MEITFTFYRQQGFADADRFMGVFTGPGSPLSEWALIQRDQKLIQAGVKFVVVSFNSANPLPLEYISKVTWSPYLEIKCSGLRNASVVYPKDAPLTVASISTWAIDMVNLVGSGTIDATVVASGVSNMTTSTTSTKTEGTSSSTTLVEKFNGLSTGAVVGAAVGTAALAGLMGLGALYVKKRMDDKDDLSEFQLEDDEGKPLTSASRLAKTFWIPESNSDNNSWFTRLRSALSFTSSSSEPQNEIKNGNKNEEPASILTASDDDINGTLNFDFLPKDEQLEERFDVSHPDQEEDFVPEVEL